MAAGKRSWRQVVLPDGSTKLVEIAPSRTRAIAPEVMKSFEPFISPVTGEAVMTRGALREHNHVNKVTNSEDYTDHWVREERRRERFFNGEYTTAERNELKSDIADSIARASSSGYVPEHKKQPHLPELGDE